MLEETVTYDFSRTLLEIKCKSSYNSGAFYEFPDNINVQVSIC